MKQNEAYLLVVNLVLSVDVGDITFNFIRASTREFGSLVDTMGKGRVRSQLLDSFVRSDGEIMPRMSRDADVL